MRYLNKYRLLLIGIFLTIISAFTLEKEPENLYKTKYKEAIQEIADSNYKQANTIFLQLVKAKIVLPDETAFYFGKSLYHTSFYRQSKGLLETYIKLTKKKGAHNTEAMALLASIKDLLKKKEETKKEEQLAEIQKHNESTTCDGHDNYVCPVCDGSKVLLKQTGLGQVFTSCNYCDDHGQMNCKDYARYLNGTLFDK